MKDIVFIGSSGEDLRSFPLEARQRAGYQLYMVQMGLEPLDWKPMASIGPGCVEVRVRTAHDAYRVLYVASVGDVVYVLHCFQKKTRQTAKADVDLAKQRYNQMKELTPKKGGTMSTEEPVGTERYTSVWDAVEATPGAAENMRVRSALMHELVAYIDASGMTQSQAAQRFGVTQPRISDLKRGKIDLFSIDTLVNMLTAAGLHLDVRVREAS